MAIVRNPSRFIMMMIVGVNLIVLAYFAKDFLIGSGAQGKETRYIYIEEDTMKNKTGKRLKVVDEAGRMLDELLSLAVDELDAEKVVNFPIAIATSSDFFVESVLTVMSVQEHLPGHPIIYYDLGLNIEEKEMVLRMCNVTYRTIDLQDVNLAHVLDLTNFAFKAFVFHDMLLHNEAFLWLDPTVQLTQCFPRQVSVLCDMLVEQGIVLFDHKDHSVFAITHPAVYMSLPTNQFQLQKTDSYGTGIMLVSRKRNIVEETLQWLLLCSLNRECIIPRGHHPFCGYTVNEPYTQDLRAHSAGCHLYDQAIINVLLANQFTFDTDRYTYSGDSCYNIAKWATLPDNINYC